MRPDKVLMSIVFLEDFLIEIMPVIGRFPKQERYALGTFIEQNILEAVKFLHEYLYCDKKSNALIETKGRIQLLLFLLRISKRLNYISVGQYEIFSYTLVKVGKNLVLKKSAKA